MGTGGVRSSGIHPTLRNCGESAGPREVLPLRFVNDSGIDKAQQTVFNPLYVYVLTVPTNWSNTAF